jgi:hypothetical protein
MKNRQSIQGFLEKREKLVLNPKTHPNLAHQLNKLITELREFTGPEVSDDALRSMGSSLTRMIYNTLGPELKKLTDTRQESYTLLTIDLRVHPALNFLDTRTLREPEFKPESFQNVLMRDVRRSAFYQKIAVQAQEMLQNPDLIIVHNTDELHQALKLINQANTYLARPLPPQGGHLSVHSKLVDCLDDDLNENMQHFRFNTTGEIWDNPDRFLELSLNELFDLAHSVLLSSQSPRRRSGKKAVSILQIKDGHEDYNPPQDNHLSTFQNVFNLQPGEENDPSLREAITTLSKVVEKQGVTFVQFMDFLSKALGKLTLDNSQPQRIQGYLSRDTPNGPLTLPIQERAVRNNDTIPKATSSLRDDRHNEVPAISATDATLRVGKLRSNGGQMATNSSGGGFRMLESNSGSIAPPGVCRAFYNAQTCPFGDKCKCEHRAKSESSPSDDRRALRSGRVLSIHSQDIEALSEMLEEGNLEDSADLLQSLADSREASADEDTVA